MRLLPLPTRGRRVLSSTAPVSRTFRRGDMGTAELNKYKQPRQGMDWSIENKKDGWVKMTTNFPLMQIGELNDSLKGLIKKLDKFADEWDVPNDLDGYGRKRY